MGVKQVGKHISLRNRAESEAVEKRTETLCYVAACSRNGFHLAHDPADHRSNRFTQQRAATLADRRQFHGSPSTDTRFIQFPYQKTVRQKDHVCVSGLTFTVSQLTISQSQLLLSVSVECLRARPTTTIRFDNSFRVPVNLVRNENLSRLRVVFVPPLDHDADLVVDVRHLHAHAQIPLLDPVDRHRLAVARRNRFGELRCLLFDAFERQLAIKLQVADVASLAAVLVFQCVDMVLDFCTSIKAVEGEAAEDAVRLAPIDQLDGQRCHLLELFAGPLALILFF